MLFCLCFNTSSLANLRFAELISLSRRLSLTFGLFFGLWEHYEQRGGGISAYIVYGDFKSNTPSSGIIYIFIVL